MPKYFLLPALLILIASCNTEPVDKPATEPHLDEIVDLRIDGSGIIHFNGSIIHESALASHVRALHTSDNTHARLIISEQAPTGVVQNATSLLYHKGLGGIRSKVLTPGEFDSYDRRNLHIDVLSSGKIFFRGHELFPADLSLALSELQLAENALVRLSVSEDADTGPVVDVQSILRDRGLMKVSYNRL